MRKRLALLFAALLAVGVVIVAVVVGRSSDDPPAVASDSITGSSDPSVVDVAVLVPASAHAETDQKLIGEAIGMWQRGIGTLDDSGSSGQTFHVTTRTLGDQASYSLHDQDVVILAATPPGTATPPLTTLDVYDGSTLCDSVSEPFAFDTWSTKPTFNSHHTLPEGTYLQPCGTSGADVCFAVNATLGATTQMSDLVETFGLVSDEFGHCLSPSVSPAQSSSSAGS